LTFLSAGIDTTSVLMNNVLLILAEHPDIQERLHNELKLIINNIDNITAEEIENMKYLDMIIRELHRYRPVNVLGAVRYFDEDRDFGEFILKKGDKIFNNI